MIQLSPFKLTRKKYFSILVYNRFRKYWWLYLIMIAIAIFYIPKFQDSLLNQLIVLFPFVYPSIIVGLLFRWAYSKKNANLFEEAFYSFDESNIYVETAKSKTQFLFSSIVDYKSQKEHLILYLSKGQFLYVPKSAFMNQEDEKKFLDLIIHAIH